MSEITSVQNMVEPLLEMLLTEVLAEESQNPPKFIAEKEIRKEEEDFEEYEDDDNLFINKFQLRSRGNISTAATSNDEYSIDSSEDETCSISTDPDDFSNLLDITKNYYPKNWNSNRRKPIIGVPIDITNTSNYNECHENMLEENRSWAVEALRNEISFSGASHNSILEIVKSLRSDVFAVGEIIPDNHLILLESGALGLIDRFQQQIVNSIGNSLGIPQNSFDTPSPQCSTRRRAEFNTAFSPTATPTSSNSTKQRGPFDQHRFSFTKSCACDGKETKGTEWDETEDPSFSSCDGNEEEEKEDGCYMTARDCLNTIRAKAVEEKETVTDNALQSTTETQPETLDLPSILCRRHRSIPPTSQTILTRFHNKGDVIGSLDLLTIYDDGQVVDGKQPRFYAKALEHNSSSFTKVLLIPLVEVRAILIRCNVEFRKETICLLQGLPFFQSLSQDRLMALADVVQEKVYEFEGQACAKQGCLQRELSVVAAGAVQVRRRYSKGGPFVTLATLQKGGFFGDEIFIEGSGGRMQLSTCEIVAVGGQQPFSTEGINNKCSGNTTRILQLPAQSIARILGKSTAIHNLEKQQE